MRKEYLTISLVQTKKLGKTLAQKALKSGSRKRAFVVGLSGELGSGKTTFLQGFAKGLGIRERVLSPTFIIIRRFSLGGNTGKNFYHIDCYRIQKSKELLRLGFKKMAARPQNIIAIEWVDRIKKILPKNIIMVEFNLVDRKTRKISFLNIKK